MDGDNTQTKENSRIIKICLMILVFLFVISACILGILLRSEKTDKSIGGFIDLSPDYERNTRFVIIGGRVFYPNKETVDYSFPKVPPKEITVEKCDDGSEKVITLQEEIPDDDSHLPKDPTIIYKQHYMVTSYPLGDNRSKDFKDEVKWIELLTFNGSDKTAWTQETDIDLFQNKEGKILNLSPGTKGYFRFQLNNKSGTQVHAVMSIDEPEGGIHLPMIFTLEDEINGKSSPATVLENDNAVELSFDIDKDGSGLYRLNWEWPYESGDDAYDGAVGNEAGKYILNTKIYAETKD